MASFLLCCFSDDPLDDPRNGYGRQWQTNLADAPCNEPVCCIAGFFLPQCTAYQLRKEVLGGDLGNYMCCQGYFDCAPFLQAGNCGERDNPECCLLIESFFCTHFAVQANRFYMMDTRQIHPDPVDYQIIRCHNALQCLACLCELAACISRDADIIDAAQAIRLLADAVYAILMSCFAAQVKLELRAEEAGKTGTPAHVVGAPNNIVMNRAQPSQPQMGGPQPGYGQQQPMYAGQQQPMYAGQMPVAQPVGGGHVAYAQGYGQQPMYQQPYGGGMPVAQGYPGQPIAQPMPMGQPMAVAQPVHAQTMYR